MDWIKLKEIPKFTSLNKVFELFGKPKFKLDECHSYYMGNGFVISYYDKQFRIEGVNRIEYGNPGQYTFKVAFFQNKYELETYYMLEHGKYNFDYVTIKNTFNIIDGVNFNDTYEEVITTLKPISSIAYYQEGETRQIKDGVFQFEKKYITWGNYQFLFFGESKKTKMTAYIFRFK